MIIKIQMWSKCSKAKTILEFIQLKVLLLGTVAVTTVHFWTSALFYLYLDLTGKPGFLYKYDKIIIVTKYKKSSFWFWFWHQYFLGINFRPSQSLLGRKKPEIVGSSLESIPGTRFSRRRTFQSHQPKCGRWLSMCWSTRWEVSTSNVKCKMWNVKYKM